MKTIRTIHRRTRSDAVVPAIGSGAPTWLSVFLDLPADAVPSGLTFWQRVTGYCAGAAEGRQQEFLPLEPASGGRYLWIQRIHSASPNWHPDLHVDELSTAVERATSLGASIRLIHPDLVAFTSPNGVRFCLCADASRGAVPPPAATAGGCSRLHQLCLDVPAGSFDAECSFWSALTGWPLTEPNGEFRRLESPATLPVRFLLQRLDGDDDAPRAHADLAADDRDAEVTRHIRAGAQVLDRFPGWTTMRDPAGAAYCITTTSAS